MPESDEPNRLNDTNRAKPSQTSAQPTSADEPGLSPELQASEAAWARLRPRGAEMDRDQLLYRAGWAAAETALNAGRPAPLRLVWPVALGGMTAVAAMLFGALLIRPEPAIRERVVDVPSDRAHSTDAARALAHADAGASAADGGDRNVWTARQFQRAALLGSSSLANDLLPADAATTAGRMAPQEPERVLSSRSFDSLFDESSRVVIEGNQPDCQTPSAVESTHEL